MSKSRTVEQYLERDWSPVDLARWIDMKLIDTTPMGFTTAGWRKLKAARRQREAGQQEGQ